MKRVRSLVVIFLVFTLLVLVNYHPVQAQIVPMDRLKRVENIIFGHSREDKPILQRVADIEKALYGQKQKGSLVERSSEIINYVLPGIDRPSLVFILNTLEWSLKGNISRGSIRDRIHNLEQILYGEVRTAPLKEKIDNLVQTSLPSDNIPAEKVTFPADKLIKIELLEELNSEDSEVGEEVEFKIVKDIKYDNKLIIPGGSKGTLVISKIEEAGKIGKDAKMELEFSSINAIDGSPVNIKLDEKSQEENRNSRALAAGASFLGTAILGPVGLIAGYFVEGKEKNIPAGTELYVQTEEEVSLYGLKLK